MVIPQTGALGSSQGLNKILLVRGGIEAPSSGSLIAHLCSLSSETTWLAREVHDAKMWVWQLTARTHGDCLGMLDAEVGAPESPWCSLFNWAMR